MEELAVSLFEASSVGEESTKGQSSIKPAIGADVGCWFVPLVRGRVTYWLPPDPDWSPTAFPLPCSPPTGWMVDDEVLLTVLSLVQRWTITGVKGSDPLSETVVPLSLMSFSISWSDAVVVLAAEAPDPLPPEAPPWADRFRMDFFSSGLPLLRLSMESVVRYPPEESNEWWAKKKGKESDKTLIQFLYEDTLATEVSILLSQPWEI